MILNAMHGDSLPVYGDGMQVRNWLYWTDFAAAIGHVLDHGEAGEVYNCGGPDECPNIDVVKRIIDLTGASEVLIEYVTDRPGPRPALLALVGEARGARLEGPHCTSPRASRQTVAWYRDNPGWWEPIRSGDYREYYERQYGRSLG